LLVDVWSSGGLPPSPDDGGRAHGLAALFGFVAAARDLERLLAPVVGRAEALLIVLDDLSAPADISVWCHDEMLEPVQLADTVSVIDPAAVVEVSVDGLLDDPEICWQVIVAVVGPAQDVEGSVDVGDVAGHGVSTDWLKENR
jgi:hypothetical protein